MLFLYLLEKMKGGDWMLVYINLAMAIFAIAKIVL